MNGDRESNESETDVAGGAPPPSRRRRFQFSLATLIWLTTLAACLAAIWAMYCDLRQAKAELRAAREEVQKYRAEMGYLDVSDPGKIHARAIRTAEDNKWSWRVYLPVSSRFRICVSTKNIPPDGFPIANCGQKLLHSGEQLVDASMGPARDGTWKVSVLVGRARFADEINAPTGGVEVVPIPEAYQEMAEPERGLPLLRWRNWGENPTQSCPGVMIWIEEAK